MSRIILAPLFFIHMLCAAEQTAPLDATEIDRLDGNDPAVTKAKKAKQTQTMQTVQNGEQTEVNVTTGVGTYIAKPNQTPGNSLPGDAQSSSNHAVQWVLKRWGGSQNTEPDDTPPTLETNPNDPNNTKPSNP